MSLCHNRLNESPGLRRRVQPFGVVTHRQIGIVTLGNEIRERFYIRRLFGVKLFIIFGYRDNEVALRV